jgi:molybdopterin-guanine dinucleotide biosynthesis protein A
MTAVIGVVLAGGESRRMGTPKAIVEVGGRPLLRHPLDALREVCGALAVVAKKDSVLPALGEGVALWLEPDEPRHPLTGLLHALRCAGGADILVCAVDLAAVDAQTLGKILLAAEAAPVADAVVPRAAGRLQPLCALYRATAMTAIEGHAPGARVHDVVATLSVAEVSFGDAAPFANINTPGDVDQARRA